MLQSKRKRELFKQQGRSANVTGGTAAEAGGSSAATSNEDSGLSASVPSTADSGCSLSKSKTANANQHSLSYAQLGQQKAADSADEWTILNAQIKQICLDCTRQFGGQQNIGNGKEVMTSTKVQSSSSSLLSNSNNKPDTPCPSKKSFSLPRLFLPRRGSKEEERQQKRGGGKGGGAINKDKEDELPIRTPMLPMAEQQEQHSPTTTTSAYGTGGGTDTGQESPVEKGKERAPPPQQKQQQGQEKQEQVECGNLLLMIGERGRAGSHLQLPQQQKRVQQKKSVKFESSAALPPSAIRPRREGEGILPPGPFYTSAERLAETLAQQQRILRQELKQNCSTESIIRGVGNRREEKSVEKQKPALIRVPPSAPMRAIPALSGGTPPTSSSSFLPQRLNSKQPSPAPATPTPPTHSSLSSIRSLLLNNNNNNDEQQWKRWPTAAAQTTGAQERQQSGRHHRQQQDKIFTFRASGGGGREGISQAEEEIQGSQRNKAIGNEGAEKTNEGKQKQEQQREPEQQQQELEWVIKRRPDGTRYVTRRPIRRHGQQLYWSAGVKARREQSLLRERIQSGGAFSTTTDDDGTGSELALASRLLMREQRRRHKGAGCRGEQQRVVRHGGGQEQQNRGRSSRGQWTNVRGDGDQRQRGQMQMGQAVAGNGQMLLLRVNSSSQMLLPGAANGPPSAATAGTSGIGTIAALQHQQQKNKQNRGGSLPGKAIFSVTTV